MASSQLVVELLADASSMRSEMESASNKVKGVGSAMERAEQDAKGFGRAMERAGDAADGSTTHFRGGADALDGMGTVLGAMGLPLGDSLGMVAGLGMGFADLADGLATTVIPAIKSALIPAFNLIAAHPIVFGIAAIIAVFVLLVNHWDKVAAAAKWLGGVITDALGSAFDFVKKAVGVVVDSFADAFDFIPKLVRSSFDTVKNLIGGVIDWIRNNWPLVLAIIVGPIGIAVHQIITHWDTIKSAFSAVKDWIGHRVNEIVGFITGIPGRIGDLFREIRDGAVFAKDWVVGRFNDLVGFISGLPGRIAGVAGGMFDGIKNAFRSALNWIIDRWNGLEFKIPGFDPPGPGPSFGGFTLGVPDIPRLARGGITTGPTLAMIGDNPGGREAVIPLPRSGGAGGGLGDTYHFHFPNYVGDKRELIDIVHSGLLKKKGRSGVLGLT